MFTETGAGLAKAAEINDAAHTRVECGPGEYVSKGEVTFRVLTLRRDHRVHQIECRVTPGEPVCERWWVGEIGFPDLDMRVRVPVPTLQLARRSRQAADRVAGSEKPGR